MIDFKITFKADELSYGNYEKISLISKIMFRNSRYNTGEIIVMDQVQKYMDGPRLLRMRLSEYIPQLSTRNVDLVP